MYTCIRTFLSVMYVLYKSSLLTLETIGYSLDMHIEYCYGPMWPYWIYIAYILDCLGQVMQVMYLGRAPRTKETLPDFLKWRRVTQPPLVFRGLTGSQRTPRFGASHYKSLKVSRKP